MSRLTDRIQRDVTKVADTYLPSPDGWDEIQRRIATSSTDPTGTELVMPTESTPQPRRFGLLAAAAALVVVLVVGVVLVAGSDDDDPATPPTETPAPETTAPDTTTSTTVPAEPWSQDAMPPGTYATTLIETPFRITLVEGWEPGQPQTARSWEAFRFEPASEGTSVHVFRDFEAESADDVAERAAANGFELSEPVDVEVGGVPGTRYDVLSGAATLVVLEFSEFGLDSENTPGRFTVLEIDGEIIVIVELAGPEAVVADARAVTEAALATLEWVDAPS